ncbi:MAG TPA: hypothetical protein VHK27_03205 [Gammaproteobacteria bacterium]|nr:hypothetical protein [Gammaproteobacteria bacterium]
MESFEQIARHVTQQLINSGLVELQELLEFPYRHTHINQQTMDGRPIETLEVNLGPAADNRH